MTICVLGSVLLGALLAQFFKFYILAPTILMAIVFVLVNPFPEPGSALELVGLSALLITGLQFGYLAGAFMKWRSYFALRSGAGRSLTRSPVEDRTVHGPTSETF